ncbi:phosphatidylglycerophosphatase A [Paramagnetospirillum kuznetsovii]|uniref:Phosphatidylglycerophosphatase A n=1 Tax=Paramagnetospirillum kuznetsovii TaxID=2053833 RepID=A0A364NZZ5_9PROT|nr:phosphatidylglycerophosphatase A [Paramagnetospirillum kuznetsovii]RAU22662.1 phosphatidylglycerophosphatase A [Paramagnetospirillum kuznetsovii]
MSFRRDGITVFHPATILSTWFGVGLLPKAPGTWGSVAALPFAWFLADFGGWPVLAAASLVCFFVGWWSSAVYVARTNAADPSEVVIDEVAGQWLVLCAAPLDPAAYLVGLALFRLFDVWKPWPVSWADTSVGGGLGVMLDDVIAALYGLVGMAIFIRVWS